jgi:type I restriction enzyme M protein
MAEKIRCLIREKEVAAGKEELVRQSYLGYLLYSLDYPKKYISVEVPIYHGRDEVLDVETNKKKRADIVIYEDESKQDIKAIIEVKKNKEETGEAQVKSYGNVSNARHLVWYNGSDPTKIWQRVKFKDSWKWKPIPILPKYGLEYGDVIPTKETLSEIKDVKGLFKSINSFIWVNSNIKNKKDIFLQFIYVLFIKLYDEYFNEKPNFYILAREYEKLLVDKQCDTFEGRIKNLFLEVKNSSDFKNIFDETDKISLEDKLLAEIVYRLQFLKIRGSDTKGEAFQLFISPYYRGENDQYLTPESVIDMMINIIKPSIKDSILDPACGTGRFLINTLNHLVPSLQKQNIDIKSWASSHIFGIDVDGTMVKISKIYMVLVGDGHTNIVHDNSLRKNVDKYHVKPESMSVTITNPPFGSKEKIKDSSVLQHYQLGHYWDKSLSLTDDINTKGLSQGILTLERCTQFLKSGGVIGIVLPEGLFSNFGDDYIRKWIVTNFNILAIISLPEETFRVKTIGAIVKTSVLIAEKKKNVTNHTIFFAKPNTIGYDIYGNPKKSNEVLDVAKYYHSTQEVKGKYFRLSLSNEDLVNRMDASFYSLQIDPKHYVPLKKYCDMFIGQTPDKQNYLNKGKIKILKVRALTNKFLDWSERRRDYVTKEWYENRKNETVDIKKYDIVIAAAAHVARYIGDEVDIADSIPENYSKVIASAKIFVIRIRNISKLNPYVLLMYLRTDEGYRQVQSIVRGQTAEIYPQDFEKVCIPNKLIKLSEQNGRQIQKIYEEAINHHHKSEKLICDVEQDYKLVKHLNIRHESITEDIAEETEEK